MLFNDSQLKAGLKRMEEVAKTKGKSAAQQQAGALLGIVKSLGKKDGPTKPELFEKAEELRWRLKRKKGSPARELKRRQRMAGLYGRQWKITKTENKPGGFRIWVENNTTYSDKVNKKKKTFDRAAKKTNDKFIARLQTLAKQVTSAL